MKYIVIFFVFAMAQLSYAQTTPSPEWINKAKEVVLTSNAWEATNAVVSGGISKDMLNDEMWNDILFKYPTHIQLANIKGDFTLLDGKNTLILKDTILPVWLTDVSVPFYIPLDVDVTGTKFLVPIYDGQNRIVKSFVPSGQGQDALADAKKSIDESSSGADKLANVQWVKEDSSFIAMLNGKEYFYQLDSSGKFVPDHPDAPLDPKLVKAGDRKKDPTFVFDGNGNLVASNKRNGYKFGMGDYAGFRNNYYRNAFNGRPLGGSYAAFPVSTGWYQPQPFFGGYNNFGYGGNYGYGGCYGGGFSAGFNINVGWSSGYGGCMGGGQYGYVNRWATGGPAVWNGYELVAIQQGFGGYNYGNYGGGYYDDGYGYKSNTVASEAEEFVDFAPAEFKNTSSVNQGHEAERFVDFGSTTASASKERSSQNANNVIAMKEPIRSTKELPKLEVPSSHRGGSSNNTVARNDVPRASGSRKVPVLDVPASHSRVSDSKPGVNRGNNGQVRTPSTQPRATPSRNTGGMNRTAPSNGPSRNGGARPSSTPRRGTVMPTNRNNGQVRTPSTQPRATPSRNTGGMNRTAPSNGPSRNGGARPSSTPRRGTVAPNRNGGGSMRARPMRSAPPSRSKR